MSVLKRIENIWINCRSRPPFHFDGYTLIELVLAIMVTSIAIPSILALFATVLMDSHDAEFMSVAQMLAIQQVEIILADKAGTGEGYGYDSITNGRYANVNPGAPFESWSRSVSIQTVDEGEMYEYKLITVTVPNPLIPSVELTAFVLDHSGL